MYLTVLGRQPSIGIAELERVYGGSKVEYLNSQIAIIDTDTFDIQRFGGQLKAGQILLRFTANNWQTASHKIINHFYAKWSQSDAKITLGLSAYGVKTNKNDLQKTGIILKQKLKKHGVSLRLVPNQDTALTTATSHHNKLGLSSNKVELLITQSGSKYIVAISTGSQNITAYAKRDQERPKRDAFVGMLPPKLAQIMINLASSNQSSPKKAPTILDPFCGTGVILQEAVLMGYKAQGTDLSDKMVEYSQVNMKWLSNTLHSDFVFSVAQGDAMNTIWQKPIDAIACEAYLGQPFSAPPSPQKLHAVVDNCDHIISEFLKNIARQIEPGTPLCVAVPAWKDNQGNFTHLPFIESVGRFGYKRHEFVNISQNDLLYFRDNQVVARELLVLIKT